MAKMYLGDGVYVDVDRDRGALVLTAEDGTKATDTIYLEEQVIDGLLRYYNRLSDPPDEREPGEDDGRTYADPRNPEDL